MLLSFDLQHLQKIRIELYRSKKVAAVYLLMNPPFDICTLNLLAGVKQVVDACSKTRQKIIDFSSITPEVDRADL